MTDSADVVVIGMGPGGEEVAGRLAERGLDVIGIESELVGGECPYWGCVPSKMMIRAANLLAEARRIPGMSGASTVDPDWGPVARRIREEATDDWDDQVAVDRFEKKGGHFVRGQARLFGPAAVGVGDRRFAARRGVVLATGGRSWTPPIAGLADVPFWTNREAIATTTLPRSLLIIGGGAIAVELGQVLARFGVDLHIVEVAPHLLPLEEPEAGALIEGVLRAEGIGVHTGATAGAFTHVAMYQAAIAVADILGDPGPVADYRALPRVTFTDPEIGSVGLSEETARSQGLSIRVGTTQIPSSARGWIHKAGNEGLIKLVEDADRGVLIGALSVGPAGGEVLGLLTLAVHAEVPTSTLRAMIYAYPTFHRAIEAALEDLES